MQCVGITKIPNTYEISENADVYIHPGLFIWTYSENVNDVVYVVCAYSFY